MYGVVAAGFTAIVTTLLATWSLGAGRNALGGINVWAYLDAAVFAAIAYGIYKEKRWAPVLGLCLYMFEKFYQISITHSLEGWWMVIILVFCYMNSIRGVYALHRLRAEVNAQT